MREPDIETGSSCSGAGVLGLLTGLLFAALRVAAADCRAAPVAPRRRQQPRRHHRSTGGTGERGGFRWSLTPAVTRMRQRWRLDMLAHEGTLLIASWFGTKPVVFAARRRLPPAAPDDSQHAGLHGASPAVRGPGAGLGAARRPLSCWASYRWHSCALTSFDFCDAADAFRAVDQGKTRADACRSQLRQECCR